MKTLHHIGRFRAKGHTMTEEVLALEWAAIEKLKRSEERALERAAQRLFTDQEADVLRNLEEAVGDQIQKRREVLASLDRWLALDSTARKGHTFIHRLFNVERWRVVTAELFAPLLARTMRSGFDAGSARVNFTGDLTSDDPEVLAFLQMLTQRTAGITDATADELARVVQLGLSESDTIPLLRARISRLFGTWRNGAAGLESRADLIAQTSGVAGFERGQQLAFVRAGVTEKAWLTRRDGRVRRPPKSKFDHVAADGQRVPTPEPFIVSGQKLMHPGDFSLGASGGNTIRCRCSSLPILNPETP